MKNRLIIGVVATLFASSSLITSCEDYKEDYYNVQNQNVVDSELIDYIKSNENFSQFYSHIQGTEIDTLLSRATSYTLFIPENSAFEGVTYSDEEWVKVLKYHISNSYYTKNMLSTQNRLQTVLSTDDEYDGYELSLKQYKSLEIADAAGVLSINDIEVGEEHLTKRSVIYSMPQIIAPTPSIWEWLQQNKEAYSYIYESYKAAESLVFDQENSVKIGFDEFGNDIYDEVYKYTNTMFDASGYLNAENDIYTCGFFSNEVYDQATATIPSFSSFPENLKQTIFNDFVQRYIFEGNQQLPFSMTNTLGEDVEMAAEDFDQPQLMSNGTIYNFKPNTIEIDLDNYIYAQRFEVEDFATWAGGNIALDGLIGGAVDQPTDVETSIGDGAESMTVKRFQHKMNNAANRIPFGLYVDYSKVLPITYTVRWRVVNPQDKLQYFKCLYFKEFKSGVGAATGQSALVASTDTRDIAKNFELRMVDADGNVLHTAKTIYANNTNGVKEGPAVAILFDNIRKNDTDLYAQIEACDELYFEYDWAFDSDRVLSNKFYLGFALELNAGSKTNNPIYVDVDYVDLIPKL